MKKIIVGLLLIVLIFTATNLAVANSSINVWILPEQGSIAEKEIGNLIDTADKSVYVAVYDINDSGLVNDLLSAYKKGIDVKVVMDDAEADHEWSVVSPLKKENILKTDFSKSNFMHNKFMVIDGKEVLTGSTNWTTNGFFYNNNNSILLQSKELADDYTTEFNEMWNGEFGAKSPANTPYPDVDIAGTDVQCYFAPEDHVEDHIVSEIENAKSTIDFATFTFTSIPIKNAIITKIDQGVKVRGIYEARQKSQYCTYDALKEAGASVIYDGNPKTMHNKVFVIDGKTVITGSYNPTKHANTANDENVLIIKNSSIAGQYEKEFDNLFYKWGGVDASPTVNKIVITLHPGNSHMTVNSVSQEIDPGRETKPVIIPKWGRTVVPIRAIVEALGGTIGWDGTERKVTINFNNTVIELWIDNPKAKVNGVAKWIDENNHDVKPIIKNKRTMLPLRFVAESLGCSVGWEAATKMITITYPGEKEPAQQAVSLKIVKVNYDASGNDNYNLNGEWVEIQNIGKTTVDMTGYKIHDEQNHYFYFPKGFTLKPNGTVKIYTGSGTNTSTELYWNSGRAIWNNSGDTCYLADPNGKVVDKYSW